MSERILFQKINQSTQIRTIFKIKGVPQKKFIFQFLILINIQYFNQNQKIKSSLARVITYAEARKTSGRAHLRSSAPGQHSSEKTSQRWWAVDDTVSNLTNPGMEPQNSRADNDAFNKWSNRQVNFLIQLRSKLSVRQPGMKQTLMKTQKSSHREYPTNAYNH